MTTLKLEDLLLITSGQSVLTSSPFVMFSDDEDEDSWDDEEGDDWGGDDEDEDWGGDDEDEDGDW